MRGALSIRRFFGTSYALTFVLATGFGHFIWTSNPVYAQVVNCYHFNSAGSPSEIDGHRFRSPGYGTQSGRFECKVGADGNRKEFASLLHQGDTTIRFIRKPGVTAPVLKGIHVRRVGRAIRPRPTSLALSNSNYNVIVSDGVTVTAETVAVPKVYDGHAILMQRVTGGDFGLVIEEGASITINPTSDVGKGVFIQTGLRIRSDGKLLDKDNAGNVLGAFPVVGINVDNAGEINSLDDGIYIHQRVRGSVTVTNSGSIVATGIDGSEKAAKGNGIFVNIDYWPGYQAALSGDLFNAVTEDSNITITNSGNITVGERDKLGEANQHERKRAIYARSEFPDVEGKITIDVTGGKISHYVKAETILAQHLGLGSIEINATGDSHIVSPVGSGIVAVLFKNEQNTAGTIAITVGANSKIETFGKGLVAWSRKNSEYEGGEENPPIIKIVADGTIISGKVPDEFEALGIERPPASEPDLTHPGVAAEVIIGAVATAIQAVVGDHFAVADAVKKLTTAADFDPTTDAHIIDGGKEGIEYEILVWALGRNTEELSAGAKEAIRELVRGLEGAPTDPVTNIETNIIGWLLDGTDLSNDAKTLLNAAGGNVQLKTDIKNLNLDPSTGDIEITIRGKVENYQPEAYGFGAAVRAIHAIKGEGNGDIRINVLEGAHLKSFGWGIYTSGRATVTIDGTIELLGLDDGAAPTVHGAVYLGDGGTVTVTENGRIISDTVGIKIENADEEDQIIIEEGAEVIVENGVAIETDGKKVTIRGKVEGKEPIKVPEGSTVTLGADAEIIAPEEDELIVAGGDGELTLILEVPEGDEGTVKQNAIVDKVKKTNDEVTILVKKGDKPPTPPGDGTPGDRPPEDGPIPNQQLYASLPSIVQAVGATGGLVGYSARKSASVRSTMSSSNDESSLQPPVRVWVSAGFGGGESEFKTPIDTGFDYKRHGVVVGFDIPSNEFEIGLSLHTNSVTADVFKNGGSIKLTGTGIGVSGTYLGEGFYVDAQAAVSRLKAKLSSSGGVIANDVSGSSEAVGIEAGMDLEALTGDGFAVTPRVGLRHSAASLDEFTGSNGQKISMRKAKTTIGRVGVHVNTVDTGSEILFGSIDVEHQVNNNPQITIDDKKLEPGSTSSTQVRLGLGGSMKWDEGRSELHGSIAYATGSGSKDYDIGIGMSFSF